MSCTRILAPLALALTGCAFPVPSGSLPSSLEGRVDFGSGPRHVQAATAEVAQAATVSLIDAGTGNTLATTLTTASGLFVLGFDRSFHPGVGPYYLEAVKGLSLGGGANRAGAPLVRLRTLLSYQGDWQSLSSGGLVIGKSSTALAALSNLKGLSTAQNLNLLNTVSINQPGASIEGITTPDTFAGTAEISDAEYHRAWDLVARALDQDADPIAALFLRPATATSSLGTRLGPGFNVRPGIGMAEDGWAISGLSPTSVSRSSGGTVVVRGSGLPTATDSLTVTLAGFACPVSAASVDGGTFTIRVPSGIPLGAYPLVVGVGPWSNQSLSLTIN